MAVTVEPSQRSCPTLVFEGRHTQNLCSMAVNHSILWLWRDLGLKRDSSKVSEFSICHGFAIKAKCMILLSYWHVSLGWATNK